MLALSASAWAFLFFPRHRHHHEAAAAGTLLHWTGMIAAMMFPLLIGNVRFVAGRSLWRRRHRAIALYLIGYLAPWLVYGAVAMVTLRYLSLPESAAAAFVIAALWQITPWKQSGLRDCHRTDPLAPFGWRADADSLRSGARSARSCLLSCWALMLPCAAGAGNWMMPAIAVFTLVERTTDRPRQSRFASVLLLAAVAAAAYR